MKECLLLDHTSVLLSLQELWHLLVSHIHQLQNLYPPCARGYYLLQENKKNTVSVYVSLSLLQKLLCVCVCVCLCVCVTYQHNLFLKIPKLLPLCKVAHFYLGIQEFFPAQFSTSQEIKCLNFCLIDIRMHCFEANIKKISEYLHDFLLTFHLNL